MTAVVDCPLGCGQSITAKGYSEHYSMYCPNVEIICPHGCGEKMARRHLKTHQIVCMQYVLLQSQFLPDLRNTPHNSPRNSPRVARRTPPGSPPPGSPIIDISDEEDIGGGGFMQFENPIDASAANAVVAVSKATNWMQHAMEGGNALIHNYPHFAAVFDGIAQKYMNIKTSDERLWYAMNGVVLMLILYVLSAPLFYMLRLGVLVFVIFCIWYTLNSTELAKNEKSKSFVLLGFVLVSAYLVKALL